MMRLTGQRIFEATQALAAIINDKRPMPGKGAYRVTKMHKVLFAEFTTLNDERTAKIKAYGYQQPTVDGIVVSAETAATHADVVMQDAVPDDKMEEFVPWWKEIAAIDSDVNVEPIPIDQLCAPGADSSITFAEFAALGDLVAD